MEKAPTELADPLAQEFLGSIVYLLNTEGKDVPNNDGCRMTGFRIGPAHVTAVEGLSFNLHLARLGGGDAQFWQRVEAVLWNESERSWDPFFHVRWCNDKFRDIEMNRDLVEHYNGILRGRMLLEDLASI